MKKPNCKYWRNDLIFLKFMMRNISEVNSRLKCKFIKAFLPFFILAQSFVIFLCGIYKRLCKTLKNTNGSCTKSIFLWFFFQYRLLFYVFSEYDNIKWEDHFSIIVFFLYDGWLSKKMSLVKTFLLLWTTKHHKETAGKKTTHYTIEVKSIINGINICT